MGIEYRSKNKCRLVVYAGTDAYGRVQRFTKTVTYTSKRDAEKQYRQFESEIENGAKKELKIRVSEMMDGYMSSRKRKGLRTTTLNQYEVTKQRILDTLGDPFADRVTRKMIDDWIGMLDDKEFASKTIKNTVNFLSACYERYIDLEQLDHNPCKRADIPDKPGKNIVTLSAEEIIPFYNALHEKMDSDPDFVVAVELMLFCGLRRSEVAGLKERDIDMKNRTLHVNNARHTIHGKMVEEGTKTVRSNRVLSLPDFVFMDVVSLITFHKKSVRRNDSVDDAGYLILDVSGEPVHPNTLYDRLKKLTRENGLSDVTLHGLRHTYASMLKWRGRDLVEISGQLGHSQQSTTLNIYTHLFQDASVASKSIATDIDQFIAGSK